MVSAILSRLVVLTAGTLYPAYRSFKAVRTKDRKEYVKWMMYWIIFAFFSFFEAVTDFLFSFWFPFYYEVKIIFVLWLLSPWTKGSSIMYRKWVHPMLLKHEREIDHMLEKAKRDSYNQVVRFGSRGLLCAREVIASAALRGQAQLLQQIQRSYSTSDINREPLTMTNPMQNRNLQSQDPNDIDDDEMRIWDDEFEQQQLPQREHPVETIREEAEEDVADASKMSSSRRTRASSKQRTSPIDPLTDTKYNTLPRRSARSQQNITT